MCKCANLISSRRSLFDVKNCIWLEYGFHRSVGQSAISKGVALSQDRHWTTTTMSATRTSSKNIIPRYCNNFAIIASRSP